MPSRYHLIPNSGDSHQTSPYWVLAIIPQAHRQFLRRAELATYDVYRDQDLTRPVDMLEPGRALVLTSEVLSWQVSGGKDSPHSYATFNLTLGEHWSPTANLGAGDHVLFWAMDNQADFERIKNSVATNTQANDWYSGLKFVGRLNAPRRARERAVSGARVTNWTVSAVGFAELGHQIYYDESMRAKYRDSHKFMVGMGINFQKLVDPSTSAAASVGTGIAAGLFQGGALIEALLRVLLGITGDSEWGKGIVTFGDDGREVVQTVASPNAGAKRIPRTLGNLLLPAVTKDLDSDMLYADICQPDIGIQNYPHRGDIRRGERQSATGQAPWQLFTSDHRSTRLSGSYAFQYESISGRPIWEVAVKSYLNAPINEAYVALRPAPWGDGSLIPRIVVRQVPFSSAVLARGAAGVIEETPIFGGEPVPGDDRFGAAEAQGLQGDAGLGGPGVAITVKRPERPLTTYTELPRWVLDARLVLKDDLGPSDAARINYVAVYGANITKSKQAQANDATNRSAYAPPIVALGDIARNGLGVYQRQTHADTAGDSADPVHESRYWNALMADFLTDQHLRWNGTIVCAGIQEPVCIGDNLEYDGGLYHIERVSHQGGIDGAGRRTFMTTLYVTNGLSLKTDAAPDNVYMSDVEEHEVHLVHDYRATPMAIQGEIQPEPLPPRPPRASAAPAGGAGRDTVGR